MITSFRAYTELLLYKYAKDDIWSCSQFKNGMPLYYSSSTSIGDRYRENHSKSVNTFHGKCGCDSLGAALYPLDVSVVSIQDVKFPWSR